MRFTVNPADFSPTDPDEIVRLILESDQLPGGSIIDRRAQPTTAR